MAFDRSLWGPKFSQDSVPAFVCPTCTKGTLQFDKKLLIEGEPQYSKEARGHNDWEPDWKTERFAMLLKCGAAKCGEFVAVAGQTTVEQVDDEERGWVFESLLVPVSMSPPPPIIQIPEKTPDAVRDELNLSFQLFWSDPGAAATRIRTSVERLMDHLKVAKYKRETGKKLKPISLYARIEAFIAKNGQIVHQDHLHALRVIGNLGTHSSEATRSDVLEAFQVYEHALDELIGKKSAGIAKLAKKLKKK